LEGGEVKVLTENALNKLIEEVREESFRAGYDKGYEFGLKEGLTADKTGIYISKSGLHIFNDGELKSVINENKKPR
jgi:flagellar biosynthesis/type III secretory pathway protein FliH